MILEKIIHSLRSSIDDHWFDEDFNVAKVDLRNAFNLVSRNAVLENCAEFFPELFPWTLWCYGVHPKLWHPMGMLRSATGTWTALVLHGLILKIAEDDMCGELLFNKWYLDDGVLAGTSLSVRAALTGSHFIIGSFSWAIHQICKMLGIWQGRAICIPI